MEYRTPKLNDNPFENPEVARIWIKSVESEREGFRDKYIYPIVKQWVSNPEIKRVLDLGAGQGVAAKLCEDKEYIGLEPSEELVKRAEELFGFYGKFVRGSAYEIPFQDESFDGVFAINVWFHLKDLKKAARELRRVLKRSGKVLIINPNSEEYSLWRTWYSNVKEFNGGFEGSVQVPNAVLPRNIFYTHPKDKIIQSLAANGFRLIESKSFAPIESGRKLFEYFEAEVNG
jgi:ubiquinone/menaquinone biosynthesis C-methylase UbiE